MVGNFLLKEILSMGKQNCQKNVEKIVKNI